MQHVGFLVVAHGIFVVACRIFTCSMWALSCVMWALSCDMHAGSSSPNMDRTPAPCIGSVESYPLDHQGSPWKTLINMLLIGKHISISEVLKYEEVCILASTEIWRCFHLPLTSQQYLDKNYCRIPLVLSSVIWRYGIQFPLLSTLRPSGKD